MMQPATMAQKVHPRKSNQPRAQVSLESRTCRQINYAATSPVTSIFSQMGNSQFDPATHQSGAACAPVRRQTTMQS
jgi:hypothetical protein